MSSKTRVAFLVDGKSERALLTKLDGTKHEFSFIKREKNGRDVRIEAIAKECITLLKMASRLNRVLIVIIDKEERPDYTIAQFETELIKLITLEFKTPFDLVATDLMFENWILADIQNVSSKFPDEITPTSNSNLFESSNGSSKLDDLWIKVKSGGKYSSDKVTNSKRLFKYVQPDIGKNFSQSFYKFIGILQKHDIRLH